MINFKIFLFLCLCIHVNCQIITGGVTCADKKVIVDFHNELRTQVAKGQLGGQPKASNMQKLAWDDNLANIAQKWANNTKFQHNPNAVDSRFTVGENLYISYSTSDSKVFDWKRGIQMWFDEHKDYQYKPLVSDPKTGHYTQVVWANTLYVGCGCTMFPVSNGMKSKLYVCNYGPAGNYLNQYPYTKGNGCENLCCKNQCDKPYGNKC